MSELPHTNLESTRETMSALADGQADAAAAAELWARDTQAREAWHTYHLIGDVLRSDDLAFSARGDADFLARMRERLADEPPIVAPMPPVATSIAARHRRWVAPAAVAAGFVAVAGVLVLTRTVAPVAVEGPVVAAGPAASGTLAGSEPQLQLVDGKLIRDARLDNYLRAHRGGSAAVPGGAIGRFETVVLER
jgi:sigma-E factor negative regulatory protein RseA